jgi:hypothetical protein
MAGRFRTTCTRLLPLLLVLTRPIAVQAQDFTYTTNNGTITITEYTGSGGDVTIPDTITGLPVTSIGDSAFSGCTSLANVTIPDSVTSIGHSAFQYCTSLTSVTIPKGVAKIGDLAFAMCHSLTTITVDTLNPWYRSVDGILFDKSTNTLIQYPGGKAGSYTVPNTVTSIGNYAFHYCFSLTQVTIPDSVTNIGEAAFGNCTSLTSVTVPNRVTSIGVWAFASCVSLTNITIGNSVTRIGAATFTYCISLKSITIPSSVTTIGGSAFYFCAGLTNVTIGKSVATIETLAFWMCTGLAGVYFEGNSPSVSSDILVGADSVTAYYLPGTTGWGTTFAERPTAPWYLQNPVILTIGPSLGLQTNRFGFRLSWATNAFVAVEACTNLTDSAWFSVSTNSLTDGWSYFSDPQWTNYPGRFYRLRSL